MSYYRNVNPDLLEITPHGGRVLEIGCGEGSFAIAYKARSPLCHYVGLEVVPSAAEIAAQHLDRLLVGDFETIADAQITQGEPFNLIVMGDVLEHLRDPDAALAKVKRMLSPNGYLAICVPNIGHWSSFFHLMNGRWPSEDAGLFDRTHLRFFTTGSIKATLERNGLRTIKHRPRKILLDKAKAETWLPGLADLAERMGIDRQAFLERSRTLQNVVIAEHAEHKLGEPLHIVVAAMAPRFMDARTRLPAQYLRMSPEISVTYQEKFLELPSVPAGMAKVVILQRPSTPNSASWRARVGAALRQGWLIITEYDDHPELVGKVLNWSPERDRWTHIMGSHAVQTSTERLAGVFREHTQHVMAFPNAAFTLVPLASRADGPLRVFYGALNRGEFSAEMARSLAPAIATHPETVFEVVYDQAFFDVLPTDRKNFRPVLQYQEYLDAVESCDIALLPLAGKEFERFKSDLKYVECASRGTAVIASSAVYEDSIENGRTGLIAPGLEDWAPALVRLLDDGALRRKLIQNAHGHVRSERMFTGQIDTRIRWYRQLWAQREELHADLLVRCPWLADT